jgi:hypothetical protein
MPIQTTLKPLAFFFHRDCFEKTGGKENQCYFLPILRRVARLDTVLMIYVWTGKTACNRLL